MAYDKDPRRRANNAASIRNNARNGGLGRQAGSAISRRQFLRTVGISGGAVAATGLGLGGISKAVSLESRTSCDTAQKACDYTDIFGWTFPGVCCGGECIGYAPVWPGDDYSPLPEGLAGDPSYYTVNTWEEFWESRPDDPDAGVYNKPYFRGKLFFDPYTFAGTELIGFNAYFPLHWATGMYDDGLPWFDADGKLNPDKRWFGTPFEGRPLEMVPKPSDSASALMRQLNERTYRVENEMPPWEWEVPNFYTGLIPAPGEDYGEIVKRVIDPNYVWKVPKVKIRGWYVKGLRGEGEPGALVVMRSGRGTEVTYPYAPDHEVVANFVMAGFDVWIADHRGHGVSDGTCSLDNAANAEDVFLGLKQLETGSGLLVMDSGDVSPRPLDLAGGERLLPYGTIAQTPIILWGDSGGSQYMNRIIAKWVLARYGKVQARYGENHTYRDVTFEEYYGKNDGTDERRNPENYKLFDIRGYLANDAFDGFLPSNAPYPGYNDTLMGPNMSAAAMMPAYEWVLGNVIIPGVEQPFPVPPKVRFQDELGPDDGIFGGLPVFYDSVVFECYAYLPAYYEVRGSMDYFNSPVSAVATFNKNRGFKKLVLVFGSHGSPWDFPGTLPSDISVFQYVTMTTVKFATQALSYGGAMNNARQTTLEKELCQAKTLGLVSSNRAIPGHGEAKWKRVLSDVENYKRSHAQR